MKSVIKSAKTVELAIEQALKELGTVRENVEITVLEEPKSGLFGLIGSKDAVVRVEYENYDESSETIEFVEEILKAEPKETKSSVNVEEPVKHVYVAKERYVEDKPKVKKTVEITEEVKKTVEPIEKVEVKKTETTVKTEKSFSKPTPKVEKREEKTVVVTPEMEAKVKDFAKEMIELMHIKADVKTRSDSTGIYVDFENLSDEDTGIAIGRRAETLNSMQYILNIVSNKDSEDYVRVFLNIGGYRDRRKASIEKLARKSAERVLKYKRPVVMEPMNAFERRIVHYALQDNPKITTISEGREPYRKVVIKYNR